MVLASAANSLGLWWRWRRRLRLAWAELVRLLNGLPLGLTWLSLGWEVGKLLGLTCRLWLTWLHLRYWLCCLRMTTHLLLSYLGLAHLRMACLRLTSHLNRLTSLRVSAHRLTSLWMGRSHLNWLLWHLIGLPSDLNRLPTGMNLLLALSHLSLSLLSHLMSLLLSLLRHLSLSLLHHLRVLSCHLRLLSCHLRMLTSHLGVLPSHLGVLPSHLGVLTSHLGVLTSHLGVLTSHLGVPSHLGVSRSCTIRHAFSMRIERPGAGRDVSIVGISGRDESLFHHLFYLLLSFLLELLVFIVCVPFILILVKGVPTRVAERASILRSSCQTNTQSFPSHHSYRFFG